MTSRTRSRALISILAAIWLGACDAPSSPDVNAADALPADTLPADAAAIDAQHSDAPSVDVAEPDAPILDSQPQDTIAADVQTADASTTDALPDAQASTIDASADALAPVDASVDAPVPIDASVDAPAPPIIVSVEVAATMGSNQVRQGAGAIRLVVAGGNLLPVNALALGEFAALVVAGSTAEQLVLDVVIPHAAPVGARGLSISTPAGTDTFHSAVIVTEISASPIGNDTVGRGTIDSPVRTVTRAASMSAPGDTIYLSDGIYGPLEAWPLSLGAITLRGASSTNTVLLGSGTGFGLWTRNTTIQSLRIANFEYCLMTSENIRLRSVAVDSCDRGVQLDGTADVLGLSVSAREEGLGIEGSLATGDVILRSMTVRQEGILSSFTGVYIRHHVGSATNTLIEESDIRARGVALGEAYAALYVQGGGIGSVTVRRSRLVGPRGVQIVLAGLAVMDFGTAVSPGQNTLECNYYCVSDQRNARPLADGPVATFSGTTLNGATVQPAGLTVTGVASAPPRYEVAGANNLISF